MFNESIKGSKLKFKTLKDGRNCCYISNFIIQNQANLTVHPVNTVFTKDSLVRLGDTYGLDSSLYNKKEYSDEAATKIFEYLFNRKVAGLDGCGKGTIKI